MKVLINDGLSTLGEYTGIGQQSINLWKHVKKLVDCDLSDYRYLRNIPRLARRAAYLIIANGEAAYQPYDVIHYQNYYVPFVRGRGKKVVTIHDLLTFYYPEALPRAYVQYHKNAVRNAVKRADAIVTPSRAIAGQVLEMFPSLSPDKLFARSNGVRDIFFKVKAKEEEVRRLGIEPYTYFLYVGVLSRRKNLPFLLQCFLDAKHRGVTDGTVKLVLVGKQDFGYEEIQGLIGREGDIVELGHVPDDSLVSLYKFAKALVLPSVYEGFGIPIIEAMSQNVPVIVSNIPTSLEIHKAHNEQLLVFELGNEKTLIDLLGHVGTNTDTIRAQLKYGDISRYSYDAVAQEHLDVYRHILKKGS